MKIKTKQLSWEQLDTLPQLRHQKPRRPLFLLALLIRILSIPDLVRAHFSFTRTIDRIGKGPYLILMNHSSFLDLKMASRILFPHRYAIVSTTDAFVGKSLLMRLIGCVATQKFVTDVNLVMDIIRLIKKKKTSVLMYPEAGYSPDGTASLLPRRLGGLLKRLDVPVLMIRSDCGAFLRDPLYNGLRLRKVKTSAEVKCLLTVEQIRTMSVAELDEVLDGEFSFDHFADQKKNGVLVSEPFRATGLERILYRCPHCGKEGEMRGEGVRLECLSCGATYYMEENGSLTVTEGEGAFSHIPDWYAWEREEVRRELEQGCYRVTVPVSVGVICDHKCMYLLGDGELTHDEKGFLLTSCDGSFSYRQAPSASHSLNVDFFWYEIGDVVGLGDKKRLFFCFPRAPFPVSKLRLAAEEMYKRL